MRSWGGKRARETYTLQGEPGRKQKKARGAAAGGPVTSGRPKKEE